MFSCNLNSIYTPLNLNLVKNKFIHGKQLFDLLQRFVFEGDKVVIFTGDEFKRMSTF